MKRKALIVKGIGPFRIGQFATIAGMSGQITGFLEHPDGKPERITAKRRIPPRDGHLVPSDEGHFIELVPMQIKWSDKTKVNDKYLEVGTILLFIRRENGADLVVFPFRDTDKPIPFRIPAGNLEEVSYDVLNQEPVAV
ncbi:MAG TPA: hypothetical protein VHE10_03055 [Candidatus Paceibacterota bacterium]|nr:hypothetical protein [Candidatus Paceibacterota bacterium]